MTIDAYSKRYNQNIKKVKKWILGNLIPGADLEKDYIPDSARMPYTATRARNAKAIYKSMVRATELCKHIVPELYRITKDEFDGYIRRLAQNGYIEIRISDGIEYYDATLKTQSFNLKEFLQFTQAISAGIAEGVTTAALTQYAHT